MAGFKTRWPGSECVADNVWSALGDGVIKMNIDTDTQWSMWDGCKDYVAKNSAYLQSQIGNPEGEARGQMKP